MPTPQATHAKRLAFQICPAWHVGIGAGVVVGGAVVVVGVAVHSLAPAEDQEPAEQSVQVLTFVAPVWLEYLPATHGTQPIMSFSWSYTAI